MKKWFFSVSLSLVTSLNVQAHNHKCDQSHDQMMMDSGSVVTAKVLKSTEKNYLDPDSVQTEYLSVKAESIEGFSGQSLEKMHASLELVEKIVNTEEFKNRVLNFKNNSGNRAFASNKGLTNEQIYAQFMEGRETLQQNTPGEMNFFLKLYYKRFSKVIGWTNGSINTININWKFFSGFKPSDVAGNLAHEWTHKIGFDHKSASEHDSAPYAIGYIVREMGERALKGEELR